MMSMRWRISTLFRACFCLALATAAHFACADDLQGFKQAWIRALQANRVHDYEGARNAYLEALAQIDTLDGARQQQLSSLRASTFAELAAVDEAAGRSKDAEFEYSRVVELQGHMGAGSDAKTLTQALQRQQVLYLRDKDYSNAGRVAMRELMLIGYQFPSPAEQATSAYASRALPPTLVVAKCDAELGGGDTAKEMYDKAWDLAEIAVATPPETLQDLYAGSVAVYTHLHLTKEVEQAQQRFERIKQKQAQQAVTMMPPKLPPRTQDVVPDVVPGFKEGARPACDPVYTLYALDKKLEGTVVLRFRIAKDGSLVSSRIMQSSGFKQLDLATMNGFSRCQFSPAMAQGQAVDGEFEVSYVWKLK